MSRKQRNLVELEFCAGIIDQPKMPKGVRRKLRQPRPFREPLNNLVPHIDRERVPAITLRLRNKERSTSELFRPRQECLTMGHVGN